MEPYKPPKETGLVETVPQPPEPIGCLYAAVMGALAIPFVFLFVLLFAILVRFLPT